MFEAQKEPGEKINDRELSPFIEGLYSFAAQFGCPLRYKG